ncbi:MAG: hypothetical protein WBQ69_08870 [Gallionella sp.]
MKSIKKSITTRLAAPLFGAALFGLASQGAFALGTPSGTTISNTASLTYTVGAVPQTAVPSNPVSFVVSDKVDVVLQTNDIADVAVVSGSAPVTANTVFKVTNSGNTTHDILLAYVGTLANGTLSPFGGTADSFDVSSCAIATVTFAPLGSGTYTAGNTYITALTEDASATVTYTCTIPANQGNGTVAVTSLTATASTTTTPITATPAGTAATPGAVQTVFLANTATSLDAYIVATATLTVTKSQAVICDPINGSSFPKYIPGAYVQYGITIANSGSAAATLSQITDALQVANLTFDTGLISGTGAGSNCAAGVGAQAPGVGFGAVKGAGLVSSYAAPGPGTTADAVTAGADFNVTTPNTVTINFPTLAGTAIGAAGTSTTLNATSYITVFFNAWVK